MGLVTNKKCIFILSSLLLLPSCRKGINGIPSQLYYLDEKVDFINRVELVTNDKNNNRFIYTIESSNSNFIESTSYFSAEIIFYNYDNKKYHDNDGFLKVYDNYSNKYLNMVLDSQYGNHYSVKNVEKREIYLYYDDIYSRLGERVFEKYSYFIYLIDYNRFTNDRSKTMWG